MIDEFVINLGVLLISCLVLAGLFMIFVTREEELMKQYAQEENDKFFKEYNKQIKVYKKYRYKKQYRKYPLNRRKRYEKYRNSSKLDD